MVTSLKQEGMRRLMFVWWALVVEGCGAYGFGYFDEFFIVKPVDAVGDATKPNGYACGACCVLDVDSGAVLSFDSDEAGAESEVDVFVEG